MAFDSKKFITRTGSAAVFVVVLLGCILWNFYSFSTLFFIISLWGLQEFYKLMEINGAKPQKWMGYILGVCMYAIAFLVSFLNTQLNNNNSEVNHILPRLPIYVGIIGFVILFGISIIELFRAQVRPIENIAITVFGVFYCVLPLAFLNSISCMPVSPSEEYMFAYKPTLVFAIFLLIWSNDTFAYLCGSFIGKNKMFERISPGKTWEGTIGGGILTIGASFLIFKLFGLLPLQDWMVISVIVVIFGTLGDLVESMLKRSVGVKDSGKIMPGHGGILDRFDSLLLVAPFVFLYLVLK